MSAIPNAARESLAALLARSWERGGVFNDGDAPAPAPWDVADPRCQVYAGTFWAGWEAAFGVDPVGAAGLLASLAEST